MRCVEKILLTDIQGSKWTFESHNRLCCTRDNESPQILLNESSEEFDVITDHNGNFHIITQDSKGNMVYLTYDFVNWKKYIILQSKSGKTNMSGFKLFIHSEKVHCLYILDSGGKNMLVHHIFSPDNDATTPKAIAYVKDNDFSCAMSETGIIHILYISESGEAQYKIYKDGIYKDEHLPEEESIKNIRCIYHNGFHIIYIAKMKTYRTIIYYNPESRSKKIINFSDGNISDCAIYGNGNSICIQWIERLRLYKCVSDNDGETFKKPVIMNRKEEFIRIRSGSNPYTMHTDRCAGYISPTPSSNDKKEKVYNDKAEDIEFLKKAILMQNEKIQRLESEIDKIRSMSYSKENTELKCDTVGEINEENYRAFQNADIDSMDFENSTIFNKE